jgi:hypothetical protein
MTVLVGCREIVGEYSPRTFKANFQLASWAEWRCGVGGGCVLRLNDVGRKTNSEATNSFVLKCGGKEKANFFHYNAWD